MKEHRRRTSRGAADIGAVVGARAAPAPSALTLREAATFAVVATGAFMVVLDFFIVLVALPSIARDLQATHAQLQLVVAGYAIANAAGLIAGGRCGDIWGRKRMFLLGMALFSLASAGCAAAGSAAALVAWRIAQGAAGALLQPQVLALLNAGFEGAKRVRLFGYYAVAMGLGGVAGQAIGGALIEAAPLGLSWEWCFLINIPLGLAALAAGAVLLRESPTGAAEPTDWSGLFTATLAIVLLVLPLTYGREAFAGLANAALLAASAACAALFLLQQAGRRGRGQPHLLRRPLLEAPGFVRGAITVLVFYGGLASYYFVLGMHLQTALQLSPLDSGLAFGLLGCGFMAASANASRLNAALGRRQVWAGSLVLLAGHLLQLLAAVAHGPLGLLLAAVVVEGIGIGMVMAPLVALALAGVPGSEAGLASGIVATMQSTGNAVGVALVTTIYFLSGGADPTRGASEARGFAVALGVLSVLTLVVMWQARALARRPGR